MAHILVIEDETSTQLLIKGRLEAMGHGVLASETGAKGLAEIHARDFDLVVLGVELGAGVDGFEVCRRLKSGSGGGSVPVILVGPEAADGEAKRGVPRGFAESRSERVHRGYTAGCDAYLPRADLGLLEDVVSAVLRAHERWEELGRQNRALAAQNRDLRERCQREEELEHALESGGLKPLVLQEMALEHPDGALIVDEDGNVEFADRGARDLLGPDVDGVHLGSAFPGSGLEAFVRDAHSDVREGYRFDLPRRGVAGQRSLVAAVVPMFADPDSEQRSLLLVLLSDMDKRRIAGDLLRAHESGLPRREIGPLLEAAGSVFRPSSILGRSPAANELRAQAALAARTDKHALVRGEPGSGKNFIARVLHFSSHRSGSLISLDCGSFSEKHLRQELFGFEKSADRRAFTACPGAIEEAHLGTLHLHGIEKLPRALQGPLLETVRSGLLKRLGGEKEMSVSFRLVASSSEDLEHLAETGEFERELLELLSEETVEVPPLRDMADDIPYITAYFMSRNGFQGRLPCISEEALLLMRSYPWPGNLRELDRCVEHALAATEKGGDIHLEHLPESLRVHARRLEEKHVLRPSTRRFAPQQGTHLPGVRQPGPQLVGVESMREFLDRDSSGGDSAGHSLGGEGEPLSLEHYEKCALLRALRETGGDKLAAARLLHLGKSTLYRKLKRHGIR